MIALEGCVYPVEKIAQSLQIKSPEAVAYSVSAGSTTCENLVPKAFTTILPEPFLKGVQAANTKSEHPKGEDEAALCGDLRLLPKVRKPLHPS